MYFMPRGRKAKNINIETQIENVQNEIDKYEQKISVLKDTLKKLQDRKQKEKMEEGQICFIFVAIL